jgi:hypothetical protein
MMTRPDLWAACVAEVDSVCGDEPPAAEHLSQLPVLDAVFSEALRLYPPVPIISKDIIQNHTITSDAPGKPDIHLKVGHHVHLDIHVVNRLEEFWGPNANTFDHTRWLQGKKPYTHPYAYLPFSIGTRGCIGQAFAGMEAKVNPYPTSRSPHTPTLPDITRLSLLPHLSCCCCVSVLCAGAVGYVCAAVAYGVCGRSEAGLRRLSCKHVHHHQWTEVPHASQSQGQARTLCMSQFISRSGWQCAGDMRGA